jgi:hypothetical protein
MFVMVQNTSGTKVVNNACNLVNLLWRCKDFVEYLQVQNLATRTRKPNLKNKKNKLEKQENQT